MPSRFGASVLRRPARLIAIGFVAVIVGGTGVLMLPLSSSDGTVTDLLPALFTATSAVCVTGLVVVDTAGHWSTFGEVVIAALIQVGGLGVMTLATLLGLVVARRIGLRMQVAAQTETKSMQLGDSRQVVIGVIRLSLIIEAVVAAFLAGRFYLHYDEPLGDAAYLGVFHAISAYNNAGFALYEDSLMSFAGDPWIVVPITCALVIGGIGFPVMIEVLRAARRSLAPSRSPQDNTRSGLSLHTKMTLSMYGALAGIGVIAVIALEWTNPATLGPLNVADKLLSGGFSGITPRTAGFNSVDTGSMTTESLLVTDVLMFIGGGSAGTAGGIKVTTFALLGYVILSEIRGEPSVHAMGRHITASVHRQAITVALLGVGTVMGATLVILLATDFTLDQVLFETVSAFGTVGLSTGITADLPAVGQLVLVAMMLLGRLGPITLASALALRERPRRFERPEERPIVG